MEGHLLTGHRVTGEGPRRAVNDCNGGAVEKGGDAEQAPRPTLAIEAMAHRNAGRFPLTTEPELPTGAAGETFGHANELLSDRQGPGRRAGVLSETGLIYL